MCDREIRLVGHSRHAVSRAREINQIQSGPSVPGMMEEKLGRKERERPEV